MPNIQDDPIAMKALIALQTKGYSLEEITHAMSTIKVQADPDWKAAEEKLDTIAEAIEMTRKMPGVNIAFYQMNFTALQTRFNNGERTRELYEEIMEFSI